MARPSTVFSWAAVAATYRAVVPAAIRNLGWVPFSQSVVEQVNQALFEVGEWIGFFAGAFPADDKLNIGKITGIGDPDGSGRGLVITTDGTGTGILVQPPVNDAVRIEVTGTASATMVAAAGGTASIGAGTAIMGFSGPNSSFVFTGGAEAGGNLLRYPYRAAAPLTLTLPLWPGLGGWSAMFDNAVGPELTRPQININSWVIENLSGSGNISVDFRAPLPGIVGNAEASVTIYTVTAIASTWSGTAGAVDPDVELVSRLIVSPFTETTIATVNNGTPTWSGSAALTPATHHYYMRVSASIPNSGTQRTRGLQALVVTITKRAVE